MSNGVGALVLAAGFSNRFGSVKLCAKLESGHTVFEQTLARLREAVPEVIVITRPDLAPLLPVSGASLEIFEDAEKGMGATLAHGISRVFHWQACLVCLADMPFIKTDTYRELAAVVDASHIVLPHYDSRPGNPVAFGRAFFEELSQLSGDTGGRAVIRQHPQQLISHPVSDPAILADIDTPEDLQRLQEETR